MAKTDPSLSQLSRDEKDTLYRFAAMPEYFSVDWFKDIEEVKPSHLLAVITFLEQKKWVVPQKRSGGIYRWTDSIHRESLLDSLPSDKSSHFYREAANVLLRALPEKDENAFRIARICLLAGLESSDLEIVLRAALFEEKHHRIASAITLFDRLLEFMEICINEQAVDLSVDLCRIFITAIERRALLSPLHPNIKKIKPWLFMARQAATQCRDSRSQAALELLIGQNCWMCFQYDQAVNHFDNAWTMIKDIDDVALHKRGLQLRGLSHWIKGDLSQALQSYEDSLGELDHISEDDFSLLTGLHLSQCYTQVGMPQRALGISETIYHQAVKNNNRPIVSFALANTGLILLEMKQLKDGRAYFEKALEISRRESIPMVELLAGIGLSNIECLEGRYEQAAEHFKVLYRIRKSSWYHTLNATHIFEPGFILFQAGISPVELNPVIRFLSDIRKEQLNPLLYSIIRRLQIQYLEKDMRPKEKICELIGIEASLEKSGALMALARARIDIARLYLEIGNWSQAEIYARKAWDFLKLTAKAVFPHDLQHLIRSEDLSTENRLYDLIIEMGDALTDQKNTEQLLTNIITSISRLTGSERAALFIRDASSGEFQIVASRNLMKDYVHDPRFKDTMDLIRKVSSEGESDIIQYERFEDATLEVRKIIIIPLLLGKRIKGCLYQDSRFFSFAVTPDKIRLLSALATQIAVSIDRAQAYDEIARLNDKLIEEKRYYQEEKEEFRPFGEIIGSDESSLKLYKLIHKVSPTRSTVLINGETGVGKELAARAIHRESSRHEGPFIRVNCAALPETLIDSELFGHEKGAFTGASKMKPGRFELAHNGTIFLDEVSELPPATQSRLLRILQEKEFQRVGGTKTLYSDFRLIAATNKDLAEEVEKGRFRSDLFFRLNVFPIHIPALRDRRDDIPPLASHFLKLFCAQYNRNYHGIPHAEMEKLKSYSWPGNVRELANVIERAVILGGPKIQFSVLGTTTIREDLQERPMNLKEMEKIQILQALRLSKGKVGGRSGASALLGLKRTTLIHKMKKLGISVQRNAGV